MGLSFLINREQLQVLAERKVIKRAEYTQVVDAAGIVQAAREEAQRMLQQTAEQAQELRHQGFEQGMQAARQRLGQELSKVAAAQARSRQQDSRSMVEAVVAIAKQVLGTQDGGLVFDQALRCVTEFVRTEQFLSLRVAPGDVAAAHAALERLVQRHGSTRFVNVVADARLAPMSCVVESELGTVDASLDTYLAQLEPVVAAHFEAQDGGPGERQEITA